MSRLYYTTEDLLMSSNAVGELKIGLSFGSKELQSSMTTAESVADSTAKSMSLKWQAAVGVVQNVAVKAFDAVSGAVIML